MKIVSKMAVFHRRSFFYPLCNPIFFCFVLPIMIGGAKVVIEPHRHEGVFIARGKEDALVTLNSTPGVAVYGEKRISVESPPGPDGVSVKVEYRVWNPFRSKSEFCT